MRLTVLACTILGLAGTGTAGACPNAMSRQGFSAQLPDCRAYEQVSPVDKNGGDVADGQFGAMTLAGDGSRIFFESATEFAGATHGGSTGASEYVATRTLGGWLTVSAIPRPDPVAADVRVLLSAADLRASLLQTSGLLPSTPPAPVDGDLNLYWRNNDTGAVSPLVGTAFFLAPVGSPDLSHVIFTTTSVLTGDAPAAGFKVYENLGDQLRLVSVKPDGTPFETDAYSAGGTPFSSSPFSTVGGVSDDGSHVFFNTGGEIYRRTNGGITALASPTELDPPDSSGPLEKTYRMASKDGDRVVFTSAEQLTDDANTGPSRFGTDLYRYDFDTDDLVNLAATADGGDGARVAGVLGASASLDVVYYVAHGVVTDPPGPLGPIDGEMNLYRWEDDGTSNGSNRFIATLSPSDNANWHQLAGRWTARTSREGRYLVFESVAGIPGHDTGGVKQVYRYDADGDGGGGSLTCVSCNPSGDAPMGPSSVTVHSLNLSVQSWELPRALSDDGSRVFFNSDDDLVPRDSNGETDAYVWDEGELSLLSTGTSSTDSYFFNSSGSGDDAFILTSDALVPQDTDDLVDLYDARVNGGFPAPAASDNCVDDVCQGAGSAGPPAGSRATGTVEGTGDVASPVRLQLRLKPLSPAQLRKLGAGGRIGVRVRVTRATRIRAAIVARIGGQRVVLARGAKRKSQAGTAVVKLRLSARAKRALKDGSSIRAVLRVKAPSARPQADGFRLRKAR